MLNEVELIEQIEKMLVDTKKGLATKAEFVSTLADKLKENEEFTKHFATQSDQQTMQKSFDALAEQVKAMMKSRFSAIKTPAGHYNGMWGDIETAKTAGLFILANVAGNKKAATQLESRGIELKQFTDKDKAMGADDNAAGGILVPGELIPNLIILIEKYGVFRQNALEYPMGSESAIAPKLSSGLTVYCPGAGVAPTASDPSFKSVGLNAKKWMTLTAIDSELNEDAAIAIGELVGYLIAQAFAQKEDEVGFLGDGTSTYFGHTGIAGALRAVDGTIGNIKSLVVGAGNAYSELTLANFETLCGTVPDSADNGDLDFYCSRKFYYTVMVKLAMAAGGANATEILTGSVSKNKTFLSYPVIFAQAMPKTAANSQICALLANLKQGAYLGDRRKLTIDRSTEAYFTTDQIGIRGTERVAPAVHGVGDTTDAGPICGLITAAS